MPKKTPAVAPVAAASELTDLQRDLQKFQKRFLNLKHLDVKTFAIDYFFPLMKLAADVSADQDAALDELASAIEENAGAEVELLEDARDLIIKLAQHIDKLLVVAGFFAVEGQALKDTGKLKTLGAPGLEVHQEYLALGAETTEVVQALVAAIQEANENDDDDDGDDDDDEVNDATAGAEVKPNGDSRSSAERARLVLADATPAAADVASTTGVALAPDAVIDPATASGGAVVDETTTTTTTTQGG